jgi:ubiquinone/menaquinone biosynthesis C-methylase UbiE
MASLNKRQIQAGLWNREYARGGALWRGPAHFDFTIPAGARVLELGCGNGKTLSALPRDCNVVAVDSSQKAVDLCAKLTKEKGMKSVRVLLADVCELPFKGGEFDAVVAFHVLEHLLEPDRRKAVEEIRRVLRTGGELFVKVFSTGDMRCGKGKEAEPGTRLRGRGIYYHYFKPEELRTLLSGFVEKSLSFERRKVRYHGREYAREKIAAEYAKG